MFLLVMLLCGIAGSLCLSWIGITLIGLIIVPLCAGAMITMGAETSAALAQSVIGFAILQLGYVAAGFLSGLVADRIRASWTGGAAPPEAAPLTSGVVGTLIPLAAVRLVPRQSDGAASSDDASDERVRVLILAWWGRGVSLSLSEPRSAEGVNPASSQASALREKGPPPPLRVSDGSGSGPHG